MTDISDGFRWHGVELRHLVALKAVAAEGTLAAAARKLGYSQSAISQQLMALERFVGCRLVARQPGAREVTLTEAGQRVLRHGEAILARALAADAELRALAAGSAGRLRLGTNASIGARVVPELLRRYAELVPDIVVDLVEDGWDSNLLDHIEAGDVDLTFAFRPLRNGPFESVELMHDPYVLVMAADSPWACAERPLTIAELEEVPIIVCSQSDAVDAFCRAHGIAAEIRYRIDDNETLLGLAAAGLGAAWLPRLAVDPARGDITQVELEIEPPQRVVVLVWHRDRALTDAERGLIELAGSVCADVSQSIAHVGALATSE